MVLTWHRSRASKVLSFLPTLPLNLLLIFTRTYFEKTWMAFFGNFANYANYFEFCFKTEQYRKFTANP